MQERAGDLENQVQVTQLLEMFFEVTVDEQDYGEADGLVGDDPQGIAQQPHVVVLVDTIEEQGADHDGDGG